jgi:hypothetical protein
VKFTPDFEESVQKVQNNAWDDSPWNFHSKRPQHVVAVLNAGGWKFKLMMSQGCVLLRAVSLACR